MFKKTLQRRYRMIVVTVVLLMSVSMSIATPLFAQTEQEEAGLLQTLTRNLPLLLNPATAPLGIGLTGAQLAKGASESCLFSPTCWLISIAGSIFKAILWLQGVIIEALATILFAIVKYNSFVNSAAVVKGWTVVRDVSNMFFVVILLAVAIGTILRVESYNFKKLLPKIILMAILVNFSRLICGIIIDGAQVIMLTFVAGFEAIKNEGLTNILHIDKIISGADNKTTGGNTGTDLIVLLASGTLAVGMLFITIGVLLALVVFLIARMVMLWLLIVLSPLAYILAAFPQGQRYATQWWSEFVKNVITGPVLAFFLWLAFTVASSSSTVAFGEDLDLERQITAAETSAPGVPAGATPEQRTLLTSILDSENLVSLIIGIGMLLGGMMIAQQMGAAGGQMAAKAYSFGSKTAPLGVGAWASRKIKAGKVPGLGRLKGLELNPMNIVRGVRESFAERKHFEEIEGRAESGAALERGGVGGLIKGLGAGHDWADAYIKGFANLRGFQKMGTSVLSPRRMPGILREIDEEKERANQLEEHARMRRRALTMPESDRMEAATTQFLDQNLQARAADIELKRAAGFDGGKYNKREMEDVTFSDEGKEKREVKEMSIDDVMKNRGIDVAMTPAQLRAAGRTEDADRKEEFLQDWDKAIASKELGGEFKDLYMKAQSGDATSMKEIDSLVSDHFTKTEQEKVEEVKRLEGGGLTNAELQKNEKQLLETNKRMAYLLKKISDNKAAGLTGDATRLEEEFEKVKNEIADPTKGSQIGIWNDITKSFDLNRNLAARRFDDEKDEDFAKRRGKLLEKANMEKEESGLLKEAGTWDDARRKQVQAETERIQAEAVESRKSIKDKQHEAAEFTPPRAFYAARDRRALENEEMKKITTELDSELIAAFRDALHEGNASKSTAILKKIVADANDNEVLNDFGFTSDSQGMHDFVNAVLIGQKGIKKADGTVYDGPSLDMDQQTAYSVENDIAFSNESINHWETARLMEVENGRFKQLSEPDHAKNALAEIMKKNTREVARAFNRLAYGGEKPRADGSGRDFKLSALGAGILKSMGPEIGYNIGRGEYNKNAVMNIGKLQGDLQKIGVDPAYMSTMSKRYERLTQEAGDSIGMIVDDLFAKYSDELRQFKK